MKTALLTMSIVLMLAVAGCTTPPVAQDDGTTTVAATFFPLYELTKMVVGTSGETFSVVPTQSEPHSFTPSPQDIIRLNGADVFVTLGVEFEEFEEELIEATKQGMVIINAGENVELIEFEEDEHDDEEKETHAEHEEEHHDEHDDEHHDEEHADDHSEHEEKDHDEEHHDEDEHEMHEEDKHDDHGHDHHHHGGVDPHIWLAPNNAIQMVQNIAQGLKTANPAAAANYEQNANNAIAQLQALDQDYRQGLASCTRDTILVAHNAYTYLAQDYGFETIEIAGLSPEAEPTPQQIAKLIDEAREHDLEYVFYEELVNPRVAETIADQVGAQTLALNPVAGSPQEGATYLGIMRDNLAKLQLALQCS